MFGVVLDLTQQFAVEFPGSEQLRRTVDRENRTFDALDLDDAETGPKTQVVNIFQREEAPGRPLERAPGQIEAAV